MPQTRETRQKEIIHSEVEKINNFFSPEELHKTLQKSNPKIGIATVYRYLKDATKKGKLFAYKCDRKTIYSRGKKSHCHFHCEKTGKTMHFDIDNIDFLQKKIPGTITSFQIEVTGVCDDCKT
jgi:Fur family ferric uptake transcriptional regulator